MPNEVPGGFWLRFLAFCVDGMILSIPVWFVGKLFELWAGPASTSALGLALAGEAVSWVADSIITYWYFTYFYRKNGATPGKRIFGLKVVNAADGRLLTAKQVALREFLGQSLSMLTFGIGYLMAGIRKDKRALHDLIAGTKVIRVPRS